MLEKFHFPFAAFSSVICGSSSVMPVTCSVLEKTSGITSTPALSDFAVTKGSLLNAGSSAMEMLSADTVPEKIGQAQVADFHLPSESAGQLRFQLRTEAIHVHQEGQSNGNYDENPDDDCNNANNALHGFVTAFPIMRANIVAQAAGCRWFSIITSYAFVPSR